MNDKEMQTVEQTETQSETKGLTWQEQHQAREAEREEIRNRHRKNREYEGVVYKHAKPTPSPMDETHKEVAVYARVSTKSLDQTSSIENQEKYYEDKVNKTENWDLHEVYSDEGKSGTSTKHRKEFNRMMSDARDGKFDMIICASVSRFARNVSDCMDYVTKLRTMNPEKPIGVYFETENIFTLSKDADQTLGFHALLADWESGNKSRRMILSYDQRIFTNQFPVSDLLGYRHTKDGELIVQPDEAKTVKLIFLAFLSGYGANEIAEILTEKKRPTLKGRVDWNGSMVRNILTNERRWGDLEARKTVVLDYKIKKTVKNTDIREGAFVPNHHEAIVSPQIAKAAALMSETGGKLIGVPELSVIDEGTLKGFVSINPLLPGVDHSFFLSACTSVYSDEELIEIEREAGILFGEEHSKILSLTFNGYQVPYGVYFLNAGMPSMTLSKSKISFSKACYERLNQCEAIEILYHPILKSIAIRPCERGFVNAIPFANMKGNLKLDFTAKKFCQAIFDEMDWIEDYRFKFRGITKVRDNCPIMFFSLDEPRILVGKTKLKKEANEEQEEEQFKKFIPYQKGFGKATEENFVAYPDAWKHAEHGLSYLLRQRRDQITQNINRNDIINKGRKVVNPLIGVIPTQDEIEEEFQSLLKSM